jgi:hypothetical protein
MKEAELRFNSFLGGASLSPDHSLFLAKL